jgi:polyisoprenoid-binding protein YceI
VKKIFVFIAATSIVVASCSNGGSSSTLDACGCAKESLNATPNAESMQKCSELRVADSKFETDFQECLVAARAGLDTSKINVGPMNPETGLNLPATSDGMYSVNAGSSIIKWLGKKVSGQHNGTVKVKSGSIEFASGTIKSGTIIIDMTTITDEDLTGESKGKLEGHLKSDDFFSSSSNPEAKFVVKSATQKNKHQFEIIGDLTIKGITKEAKANVIAVPNGVSGLNVSGGFSIDRIAYGIKYGSGQFFKDLGDKMIDDNFMVTLDLKASK